MTAKAKKTLDSPDKIISLTQMPTGVLLLTTEKRVYEFKDGMWQPTVFSPDPEVNPPDPLPATPPPPDNTPTKAKDK